MTEATVGNAAVDIDHVLGDEYEHTVVPASARRSLFSMVMVWAGFPTNLVGTMTGSLLVMGMGFTRALAVMVLGNLIMLAYVASLGHLGARSGANFALIANKVFGQKGYILASGLLSTLLLGWFAVQTGITGALISSTYGLNYVAMAILSGVVYVGITFIGVRGLHYIGMISVPVFIVLGIFVAGHAMSTTTLSAIVSYPGNNGVSTMSMGVGLTVVLALFVDAGTVTADFNRWARNGKDSFIATFSAFPISNLMSMLFGGIMTAALAVPNANPFGADNMVGYMNSLGIGWLSVVAFAFLYINLGAGSSHCLYNASTGWSRILGSHMRLMAVILGALSIIVAATNIWAYFVEWLTLLGILVPPIGAIILVDRYVTRPQMETESNWHPVAFVAWAIGSAAAFLVEFKAPQLSTALVSGIVAGIAYLVLSPMMKDKVALR